MRGYDQKKLAVDHLEMTAARLDLSKAWTCPWEDLAGYEIVPGCRVEDTEWILPVDWFPPNERALTNRRINFTEAVPPGTDAVVAQGIMRRLQRWATLDFTQTLRIGRADPHSAGETSTPPAPVTWVKKTKRQIAAACHALSSFTPDPDKTKKTPRSECPDGAPIFALLSPKDFDDLKTRFAGWSWICTPRNNALFAAGLMDDWPAKDVSPAKPQKRRGSRADQPFSDAAFTEILGVALWLSSLTPETLAAYLGIRAFTTTPNGRKNTGLVKAHRTAAVRAWVPGGMRTGEPLPYGLRLHGAVHWTFPLDGADLRALEDLLMLCQAANAALSLGSTGKRIGELTGLRPDALRMDGDRCYLDGEAYKSNDGPHGQLRTWPLPRTTVDAFKRQYDLCAALARTDSLWVTLVERKNSTGIPFLAAYIRKLGTAVILPDGRTLSEIDGKLSPHRFRFTVARLAALSLEGADQILFDVLGHDDTEVTLGYMRRDPELVEDMNRVRREVRAVRTKEVFDQAE